MVAKIDRTGEERLNNFGSKMIIARYKNAYDVDVYFPEYNWTARNTRYDVFKKGNIVCSYERRAYGVGYLGEGKYKVLKNGKPTKCYQIWHSMLQRCYDHKYHKKALTYINCEVCEEWLCFQNFAKWYYNNYYEVGSQKMCLDKDILCKGNKVYSPETCIFVPERINTLFIKCDKSRGKYPIGVYYKKQTGKFVARCSVYDLKENKSKLKHLGLYNTHEEAFEFYKEFKEEYIKEVADYYKGKIPSKLYDAMYNYEVEITD